MLIAVGLTIVLASATAAIALRNRGKTTLAKGAIVAMLAGNIITIAGLWTRLDPNNVVHWIIATGGTAAVVMIVIVGLKLLRHTGSAEPATGERS